MPRLVESSEGRYEGIDARLLLLVLSQEGEEGGEFLVERREGQIDWSSESSGRSGGG